MTNIEHFFSTNDLAEMEQAVKIYEDLAQFYSKQGKEYEIERGPFSIRLTISDYPTKRERNTLPPRCEACGE